MRLKFKFLAGFVLVLPLLSSASYAVFIDSEKLKGQDDFGSTMPPPSDSKPKEEDKVPPYAPDNVLVKLKPANFSTQTSETNEAQSTPSSFGPKAPKLNQLLKNKSSLQNAKLERVFKGKRLNKPFPPSATKKADPSFGGKGRGKG